MLRSAVVQEGSLAEIYISLATNAVLQDTSTLKHHAIDARSHGHGLQFLSNADISDSVQKKSVPLGMTVAVIGLPAGLEPRFDRLREVCFYLFLTIRSLEM